MQQDMDGASKLERLAVVVALSTILALCLTACGEPPKHWADLRHPLYVWTQAVGPVCAHHLMVDSERNVWEAALQCDADDRVAPAGGMTAATYDAVVQAFDDLWAAEPGGGSSASDCAPPAVPQIFVHRETPNTSIGWLTCGVPDDATSLQEPFATIARGFIER